MLSLTIVDLIELLLILAFVILLIIMDVKMIEYVTRNYKINFIADNCVLYSHDVGNTSFIQGFWLVLYSWENHTSFLL